MSPRTSSFSESSDVYIEMKNSGKQEDSKGSKGESTVVQCTLGNVSPNKVLQSETTTRRTKNGM
jgi:hypothetical protein